MLKPEESLEETARRIKEDTLARNNVGYFKLWRMKRRDKDNGGWPEGPWVKDNLLGIFGSRLPCEAYLDLLERGPEASYEYVAFDHDISHIKGHWTVEINDEGDGVRTAKWSEWGDAGTSNFRHGENRISGQGRTKSEAIASARRYRDELLVWNRDEMPKRPKGCHCQPRQERPCGICERHEKERKKKDCGCPHCEGDHGIPIRVEGTARALP